MLDGLATFRMEFVAKQEQLLWLGRVGKEAFVLPGALNWMWPATTKKQLEALNGPFEGYDGGVLL